MQEQLPDSFDEDFMLVIANVPLEHNYYSRSLDGSRAIVTFHEINDILSKKNIPLENIILRMLYSYSFVFKRNENRLPLISDISTYTHDETRGCLFDMNGTKTDVFLSCDKPIICDECVESLKHKRISINMIKNSQSDLKQITKPLFFRLADFVKRHPIWSLMISAISAIFLGIIGSLLAEVLINLLK
ncbi:MAG: hypothetical protein KAI40_04595 [Desulfobacterales bacterium]|nr:hypothetical protein [Desulfobacterales bacterium]